MLEALDLKTNAETRYRCQVSVYRTIGPLVIFRGIGRNFSFLFHFLMKILSANRIAPDGTPRFATSHLGLFCLPMSHKKDARLIWVETKVAGSSTH